MYPVHPAKLLQLVLGQLLRRDAVRGVGQPGVQIRKCRGYQLQYYNPVSPRLNYNCENLALSMAVGLGESIIVKRICRSI